MPSLGPAEILVVLVIALLVFGPDKMPDMARQAGRAFREFRRVQQHLRSEISGAISDLDGPGGTPSPGDAPDASSSGTVPGGDPVPMLPPLDPDLRQPDAQAPPGVTATGTTDAPAAAPPAAPDRGAAPGSVDQA